MPRIGTGGPRKTEGCRWSTLTKRIEAASATVACGRHHDNLAQRVTKLGHKDNAIIQRTTTTTGAAHVLELLLNFCEVRMWL